MAGRSGKLRRRLESLRSQGGVKDSEVVSLAEALDRKATGKGKHPTYASKYPGLNPVSIPCHGGRDLNKITKNKILDELEDDLIALEEAEKRNARENGHDDEADD